MKTFKQIEKEYLLNALKESNFNVDLASDISGIARATFYRKLNIHFGEGFIKNFRIAAITKTKIIAISAENNSQADADLMNNAFELGHAAAKNIDLPST